MNEKLTTSRDIEIETSVDIDDLKRLSELLLQKNASITYQLRKTEIDPDVTYLTSAYELLTITLTNRQILSLFMSSFAVAAGIRISGFVSKVFGAFAEEAGKDLYKWMKETLKTAINEGKNRDSQQPPRDRLGALRLVLRGHILDEIPFFAYLTHEYGPFHSDRQFVERADWEQLKLSELFAHVLPFTTYLLMTSPELKGQCNKVSMAADGRASTERDNWTVLVGLGKRFDFIAPGTITTSDEVECEIIKSRYEDFLKATQPR